MESQALIHERYRLERRLGGEETGATGVVHLAQDTQLGQAVAVKVLHPYFASDRDLIAELQSAYDKLSALKHPAIVRYRDFAVCGDQIVIVSEYVDGVTLEDAIKADGPLPADTVKKHVIQLCSAMHLTHSYGAGHFDLSARNLMIDKWGNLRICDFLLSRLLKDWLLRKSGAKRVGRSNRARLVELLAPEQRVSKPVYEIGCDIYATGILIHLMQTGEVSDPNAQAKRPAQRPEPLHTDDEVHFDAPQSDIPNWDYIAQKAANAKPWQRWENFIILSYALEGKVQSKARPSESPAAAVKPLLDRLRSRRIIGFTLLAVLAILAIASIVKVIQLIPGDMTSPREALTEYLADDVRAPEQKSEEPAAPAEPKPEASTHIARAKELMAEGELDAAENEVKTALTFEAEHTEAGELLRLIERLRMVNSLIDKASKSIEASQFLQAGVFLDQALEMDPSNQEAANLKTVLSQRQKIASLLKSAKDAIDKRFYTTPEDSSAFHYAREVQKIDPNNTEAKSIVSGIVNIYVRMADSAFANGDYVNAAIYYERASKIDKKNSYVKSRAEQAKERAKEAKPKSDTSEPEAPEAPPGGPGTESTTDDSSSESGPGEPADERGEELADPADGAM